MGRGGGGGKWGKPEMKQNAGSIDRPAAQWQWQRVAVAAAGRQRALDPSLGSVPSNE